MQNVINKLEASGNYRVTRRLTLPDHFSAPDDLPKKVALIVDTETTGLDANSDKIIEIGMVAVEYSPVTSRFYRVIASYSGFEDPGFSLPENITKITGITDEMISGSRFDEGKVLELINNASIAIAHQAAFDRKFLENRFKEFEKIPWGCSMSQIDWKAQGITSRSLDYLLYRCCNTFIDAHRALNDTQGLTFLLSGELPSCGSSAFEELLTKARLTTVKVWAVNAPFGAKDILKSRGYSWNDGSNKKPKSWFKVINEDDTDSELHFLTQIYPQHDTSTVILDRIDAYSRFSSRE